MERPQLAVDGGCIVCAGELLSLTHTHPHTAAHNVCLERVRSVGEYVDLCVPVSFCNCMWGVCICVCIPVCVYTCMCISDCVSVLSMNMGGACVYVSVYLSVQGGHVHVCVYLSSYTCVGGVRVCVCVSCLHVCV